MTTSGIGLYGDMPLVPVPHVKREILEEWRRRVRSESNERGVIRTEPALSRFVPELVERLFSVDDEERQSGAILVASARHSENCTVAEAIRELSLLRSAILRAFSRGGVRLSTTAIEYVHHEIDHAMAEIVSDIHRVACARLAASHRVEHALRENEDRMRLALVAAEVGTWEFRPITGELTWDDRCKQIWGLPDGHEPSYDAFLRGIHPEDRPRVEAIVEQTLEPRSGGTYKIEYRAVGLSHGPERWVSCEGKCFFDDAGRPTRFIGTVLDITERRREVEFRERFVGMLGHDLRQPLSVVNYASETLLKQGLPNDSLELVRRVVRSGDRMNRMIRDLLDFARGRQGGGIPVARKSLDLHELMRHLVDEIATVNPARTIELAVDGDGSGHWDPDRMAQVFQNLLCNAVTYGAADTPIYVVMVEEGRFLETTITNYGPPIPKSELGQLFSPYRRGGRARSAERLPRGLGLGLYIAQEIVLAHGGSIEATSDSDSGTTFTVLLPRG
ncbi:ATP-binding protein [Pendulispora albinea]|uniref:histidine kinase n=1 Tax=Pendulispora albinea TaxID=2741071 RepID=A0ABZ2LX46_9BACT